MTEENDRALLVGTRWSAQWEQALERILLEHKIVLDRVDTVQETLALYSEPSCRVWITDTQDWEAIRTAALPEMALRIRPPEILVLCAAPEKFISGETSWKVHPVHCDINPADLVTMAALILERHASQERETRISDMLENLPLGVYRASVEGVPLLANAAARRMLGYDAGEELPLGANDIDNPYGLPWMEYQRRLEEQGIIAGLETIWRRKDGVPFTVRINAQTVTGPGGQIEYYEGTIEDVSARKTAADIQQTNEERLQTLLQLSVMEGDEAEIINFALEAGVRLTGSEFGYFHFYNEMDHTLQLHAWSHAARANCSAKQDGHYPLAKAGVWADCIRMRQAVIHNNYPALENKRGYPDGHTSIHRHMSIPVIDREAIVAVMGVSNKESDYQEFDVMQLTLFGNSLWQIIKQKRVEKEFLESQERFRNLFEHLPIGLYRTTPQGEILEANDALVNMLGYPDKNTFLDQKAGDFYTQSADRAAWREQLEHSGALIDREVSWLRYDGEQLWVSESAHVVLNRRGEVQYYEGMVVDISKRRNIEYALKIANDLVEQMLSTITSILIATDEQGIISYWNHKAEEVFQLSTIDAIGVSLAELGLDWEKERLVNSYAICQQERRQVHLEEFRLRKADNKDRLLGFTLSPIFWDGEAETPGVIIQGADITKKRVMEAQLIQATKLEAIGRLASGIAHEINTPTQFVSNNVTFLEENLNELLVILKDTQKLLEDSLQGNLPLEKAASILEQMDEIDMAFLLDEIPLALQGSHKGLAHITRIVQAMREFSHPGSKEKILTDINQAILSTVEVTRHEWKHFAELSCDLARDLPPVTCLPSEFNQVMLNLIINAAHAIQDKHGSHPQAKGKIHLCTRLNDNWIEVQVIDNGIGIKEEDRGHIFEPFFTTKEVGRGTGQGLMIAYDVIVNKHQGEIIFESAVGEGTMFIVRLPLGERP